MLHTRMISTTVRYCKAVVMTSYKPSSFKMFRFAVVIATLFYFSSLPQANSAEWNYHHPDLWPGLCGVGTAQSPVNILGVIRDAKNRRLRFSYALANSTIQNTGRTLTISPSSQYL